MPKNLSSGAPSPDTSPANVARVLRELVDSVRASYGDLESARHAHALADALDAAPTWSERVTVARDAARAVPFLPHGATSESPYNHYTRQIDAALRAAFPEYAPSDD